MRDTHKNRNLKHLCLIQNLHTYLHLYSHHIPHLLSFTQKPNQGLELTEIPSSKRTTTYLIYEVSKIYNIEKITDQFATVGTDSPADIWGRYHHIMSGK